MMKYPKISILIAARNEEENIEELLQSLDKLSYPKSTLQILIGDDASTDKTAQIIRNFITSKPQYKLFEIKPSNNHLKGKTNVLAQLAREADGDYFFFTDADIEVPVNWIQAMLQLFNLHKNTGKMTDNHYITLATSVYPEQISPVKGMYKGSARSSLNAWVNIYRTDFSSFDPSKPIL